MAVSSLATIKVTAHSGNYTKGRNTKISQITIHHMAGVLSAQACGNIFAKAGRNGSAHYGVGKDGEIANYVDEADTAWSDSNWPSNCRTVSIETSNDKTGGDWHVSDTTLNSLVKLVADIAKRNGLGTLVVGKNLRKHKDFAATACPGAYLESKMDYIATEANKINAGGGSSSGGDAKKSNEEIATEVIRGDWGNGNDRKSRLEAAGYDYAAIQKIVNERLGGGTSSGSASKPTVNDEIVNAVIRGDYGNGQDRVNRLTAAGYDYNEVQAAVNAKLGGVSSGSTTNDTCYYTVQSGDDLGSIIKKIGYASGNGLWGANGDVAYYAAQNGLANANQIYPGQVLTFKRR